MKLTGGYIIDEIFSHFYKQKDYECVDDAILELSKYCIFELSGLEKYALSENTQSLDKTLVTTFNILNRGNPTRASLFITEKVLFKYGYEKNTNNKTGHIVFDKHPKATYLLKTLILTDNMSTGSAEVYDCIFIPIVIAQIQKSFLLLWLNEIVIFSSELKIHCNEAMREYFEWALTDLFEIVKNLYVLNDKEFESPQLKFTHRDEADFSLAINEEGYQYQIKTVNSPEEIVDRILTTPKIRYGAIGEHNLQNEFKPIDEKLQSLLFFLNNIFRKKDFRDGQLAIINRILQCKDVIGILPTGSGKSMTYQLTALLQPGICLIVDPIRSLMKDQYDKLRLHYIDRVIYINSDDKLEERQIKEELISKGKVQYVIIGPERFQIQEFRNYLHQAHNGGLKFSYLVIDEAHCISEWGHDFRYAYLRLSKIVLANCFNNQVDEFVQVALTATASFDVMADIQRELDVDNDSLLQPPNPDRKELHFEVEKFKSYQEINPNKNHIIRDGLYDYQKEKELAKVKFAKVKLILSNSIPTKVAQVNSNITREDFWKMTDGVYNNAGIIYCHTKSDSKGNGVYALCYNMLYQKGGAVAIEGLDTEEYLAKGTYFGGQDENSWQNQRIIDEALKATDNQVKFMDNKLNLIVATKAFGMGLDKPNVRFTIHYSLPTSIEAFYQEAGRAGRDGTHSFNYILYSPSDLETNLDYIKNSHKGRKREYIVFNELLTEIKYEDEFYFKILNRKFQEKYSNYYLNLFKNTNDRIYIYVNLTGKARGENFIVKLYLQEGITSYIYTDGTILNLEEAQLVGNYLKDLLDKFSNSENKIAFLYKKNSDGIETILNRDSKVPESSLLIGLNNDVIEELAREIGDRTINNKVVKGKTVVMSAYNFCDGESDEEIENNFISNLDYQYNRSTTGEKIAISSIINTEKFKKAFWKIRNSADTQKAIYRLNLLGVIDDYTIDYSNKFIEIMFLRQDEGFYYNNFKMYLMKYLGETEADKVVLQARNRNGEFDTSELRKCLNELTDFFAKAIVEKRIHSANYVKEAIDEFTENGEEKFRQKISDYFASKYASSFYNDFIFNTNADFSFIHKYLKLLKNPEVNTPGLEIDNLNHLIGSCERYNVSSINKNYIVTILENIAVIIVSIRNNKIIKLNEAEKNLTVELVQTVLSKVLSFENVFQILEWLRNYSLDIIPQKLDAINGIKSRIELTLLNKIILKAKSQLIR